MSTLAQLMVRIGADTSDFERKMDRVSNKLETKGRAFTDIGSTLTRRVTAPILGLATASVMTGAKFDQSMRRVQAVSGATGAQFDQLSGLAKQLGRTTRFSASEAAEGMGFLAMAGFEVNDIMDAMPGILDLAAAGNMDLARTADIASNILTGFGLEAKEIGRVSDVMAYSFTNANTDMQQLGDAMKYVAPVAASAGLSLEETATAIALMGNAGIQGSQAGTALRGAIARLLNPTGAAADTLQRLGINVFDSAGNMVPLVEIIRQLEESGATTADMMTIFGQRAGPAMAALVEQGSAAFRDFQEGAENAGGTAKHVADTQMRGLHGAFVELKSAVEGLMLALYDAGLGDVVEAIVRRFREWAVSAAEINPTLLRVGMIVAGVAAAIGPLFLVIGQTMIFTAKLIAAWKMLNIVFLASPIFWVVAALAALTAGLVIAWNTSETFRNVVSGAFKEISDWWHGEEQMVDAWAARHGEMEDRTEGAKDKIIGWWDDVKTELIGEDVMVDSWAVRHMEETEGKVGGSVTNILNDLFKIDGWFGGNVEQANTWEEAIDKVFSDVGTATASGTKAFKDMFDWIQSNLPGNNEIIHSMGEATDFMIEAVGRNTMRGISYFTDFASSIGEWASNTNQSIIEWRNETGERITAWASETARSFVTWASDTNQSVIQWRNNMGDRISGWASDTTRSITTWASDTARSFATWASDTNQSVITWRNDMGDRVSGWARESTQSITTWASDTARSFTTWASDTNQSVISWRNNMGDRISGWARENTQSITTWASDTARSFVNWASDTNQSIITWRNNMGDRISGWARENTQSITSWASDTARSFVNWASETNQSVIQWRNNMGDRISGWARENTRSITTWASDTARSFVTWASETNQSIIQWRNNMGDRISGWARDAIGWFERFRTDGAGAFNSFSIDTSRIWAGLRSGTFQPMANFMERALPAAAETFRAAVSGDWDTVRSNVRGAFDAMRTQTFQRVADWFETHLPTTSGVFRATVNTDWEGVRSGVRSAFETMRTQTFQRVADWFETHLPTTSGVFRAATTTDWEGVRSSLRGTFESLRTQTLQRVADWFETHLPTTSGVFRAAATTDWESVRSSLRSTFEGMRSRVFQPVADWFETHLPTTSGVFRSMTTTDWEGVRSSIRGTFESMRSQTLQRLADWFETHLPNTSSTFRSLTTTDWDSVRASLRSAFETMRSQTFQPVADWFETHIPNTARVLRQQVTDRWDEARSNMRSVFEVMRSRVLQPVADWFETHLPNTARTMRELVSDRWEDTRSNLRSTFETMRSRAFQPVADWFERHIPNTAETMRDEVSDRWEDTRSNMRTIFEVMRSRAFQPVADWFETHIPNTARTMREEVTDRWNELRDNMQGIWNTIRLRTFQHMVDWIETHMPRAFETGTRAIGRIFREIQDLTRDPVRFVIQTVYNRGVVPVWNAVAAVTSMDSIETIDFNRGGIIPGYQSVKRDEVTANLRKGEAVLVPEVVRALGANTINAMNDAGNRGVSAAQRLFQRPRDPNARPPVVGVGQPPNDNPAVLPPGETNSFALGGILRSLGNFASNAGDWIGMLAENITEPFSNLKEHVKEQFGDKKDFGGWGWHLTSAILDAVKDAFLGEDSMMFGDDFGDISWENASARLQRALSWARQQHGKPYIWGGAGPRGYDCSGFMGSIENVIRGQSPYSRRYTTHLFRGGRNAPPGWEENLQSPFMIGNTHRGVGHMAGTLLGVNVEARGGRSRGTHVGASAQGARSSSFDRWYGFRPVANEARPAGGGAGGGGGAVGNTVITSFWDSHQPMANGRRMHGSAIASSVIPLGSVLRVTVGGRSEVGSLDDLGPASFVYRRHHPRPLLDIAEPMMQRLTGRRSNVVRGSFTVVRRGTGRTLFGYTRWDGRFDPSRSTRGFAEGGIIGPDAMRPDVRGFDTGGIFNPDAALPVVGGYERGTDSVPRDDLYYLHRGEAVVPAAENAGYTGGHGATYNFDLRGSVISSKRDAEDMVVGALESAERKGRIPKGTVRR